MQKWEMHLHTKGASYCAHTSPFRIAWKYRRMGYTGIVCTNHFNKICFQKDYPSLSDADKIKRYLSFYEKMKKWGEKFGIKVLLGMEMSLAGDEKTAKGASYAELLLYGITPQEITSYGMSLIDHTQKELFDLAEQNGWFIAQSHPFRTHVFQKDFTLLHGLEVHNGHPGHEEHNDIAVKTASEYRLIPIGGSDFHDPHHGGYGVLFPDGIRIDNEKDLVKALKCGMATVITSPTK